MKTLKYCIYLMLGVCLSINLTSCNDDDDLGEAPRLFRPIASLESQANSLVASWDDFVDATGYDLDFCLVTGTDESGKPITESIFKTQVTTSSYRLDNLAWDEKYLLRIKAFNATKESEVYETSTVSIVYPTKITGSRTIDIATMLMWKVQGEPITAINVVPNDGSESTLVSVSQTEYESGKVSIYGLQPQTVYKLYAYSGDEQTTSTYEGRVSITTSASEDFDAIYGPGNYIDLREESNNEILYSADILSAMQSTEGLALILKGGFEYKINNTIKFEKSVTYVTGLSLEGNAVFIQSGGFVTANNAVVDKVTFNKIDFKSDQLSTIPVKNWTSSSGYSRQVYNVNGTSSTINIMSFINCTITGYRAVVRLQGAGDAIKDLSFVNCTLNAIGDQAVVTTNNQATASLETLTFENSTLTNIVVLTDLRASAKRPTVAIKNCTFCYAPIETTVNANTPLFRFGALDVVLEVSNSIFGPSMATVGSAGSVLKPYTAGTAGSIMLNGSAATVGVSGSYKTNYSWMPIGVNSTTYPLEGLESLSVDEKTLFADPENDNYLIRYSFPGSSSSGALKWRIQ